MELIHLSSNLYDDTVRVFDIMVADQNNGKWIGYTASLFEACSIKSPKRRTDVLAIIEACGNRRLVKGNRFTPSAYEIAINSIGSDEFMDAQDKLRTKLVKSNLKYDDISVEVHEIKDRLTNLESVVAGFAQQMLDHSNTSNKINIKLTSILEAITFGEEKDGDDYQ